MKGSTYANDVLKLIFNATAIADLAENDASAPKTELHFALHTADPGVGGSQTTNEVSYTGYARKNVARTSGGFTVTGASVSPAANVDFAACTGGSAVATHWSIGTESSGAGKILYKGVIGGSGQGPFVGATSDTMTIPGHTLAVDDRVSFYAAIGSSLPTGITEGTVYWVKTVSGNDITISTTQGGATLDITAAGDGFAFKHQTISIATGVTPRLTTATAIVEG